MKSRTNGASQLEQGHHFSPPYTVHSEPWWRGISCTGMPSAVAAGNTSNLSSPEGDDGSESNGDQSLSNGRLNEEDDCAAKESHGTAASQSGTRNYLII
uniref:Nuclear transcription factor Y subunit A-1 n=1 Tax=Rhizophora mucronata TaxID=61149 RepID=A0A2P2LAR3_RHIMU